MIRLVVVDYGMGNLRSVAKAIAHVAPNDMRVEISADAKIIARADRVVFPGQGAARACMDALRENDLIDTLKNVAAQKPFLGICMGLQVLLSRSQENAGVECLNWIAGEAQHFSNSLASAWPTELKIPHMGWNQVVQLHAHPLWQGIANHERFYFVHSYHVVPNDKRWIAAETPYGLSFASVLARDNLFAMQCHPEKSGAVGLQLLHNFCRWDGAA
ncbi:MAG: imidazole glycerol phosphate synthase subunit HisH [Gammaproteobacteria bacterium]|nr:imidazole glycerol phosphate synthase subunit HisH [Gammaproteobacteria bacterium]